MYYYFYPPFFVVDPQTSFDEAWEVFCCEMLNLDNSTNLIRRRVPPDLGADLIWDEKQIIFQCKSVINGDASDLDISKIKQSIDRAKENQASLGWQKYVLCTNVDLTGSQEQKLRGYLPGILFRTSTYWTSLCKKFPRHASYRFRSLFPEGTLQNTIWSVPYYRNPFFTGRENIIEELHHNFLEDQARALFQPQALYGLGGIGKTQIAIEYAYRHRDKYNVVFWVQAASKETIITDFTKITQMLHLSTASLNESHYNQQQLLSLVKDWFIHHTNWLLIFDSADNLLLIQEFLPVGGKGHLLITTRDQAVESMAKSFEVEKFTEEDGLILFLKRAKIIEQAEEAAKIALQEKEVAEALVTMMDYFPLALEQAGAYIVEMRCNLLRYYDMYKEGYIKLLARKSRLPVNYPYTVMTTWSLSFRELEHISPFSVILLRLCAFVQPDFIPEEIIVSSLKWLGNYLINVSNASLEIDLNDNFLQHIYLIFQLKEVNSENAIELTRAVGMKLINLSQNVVEIDESIENLTHYSLIKRNISNNSLGIHHLVQMVLLNEIDEEVRFFWAGLTTLAVSTLMPHQPKAETWPQSQRYLAQAMTCVHHITKYYNIIKKLKLFAIAAGGLLNAIGAYFYETQAFKEVRPFYEMALDVFQQSQDINDVNIAVMWHQLARLSFVEQSYQEAETLFHRSIDLYHQMPLEGERLLDALMTFHELARLSIAQGKYEKAEALLQYTLKMKEELVGTEDRGVAAALHEIAILYQKQERYSDAEDLLKRVLLMEEKVLGNGHLDVAVTLENLSSTYMLQGKYKETYPYLERAIDIFTSIMGAEHVALLGVLLQMAVVNEKLGDYKKATLYYGKFLAIGQKEQALKKEQVISILLNVSNTFIEQNMLKEAEKSILQLISLEDYVKEENRSEYIIALNNLGCVYLQQGKPDMANQIYRRVADMLENMPDLENLEMSQIIANIGSSYILLDQYEQALPFIEEALRIRLRYSNIEDPVTETIMKNYSILKEYSKMSKSPSVKYKNYNNKKSRKRPRRR